MIHTNLPSRRLALSLAWRPSLLDSLDLELTQERGFLLNIVELSVSEFGGRVDVLRNQSACDHYT